MKRLLIALILVVALLLQACSTKSTACDERQLTMMIRFANKEKASLCLQNIQNITAEQKTNYAQIIELL